MRQAVMGVYKGLAGIGRSIVAVVLAGILGLGSFGCAKPTEPKALLSEPAPQPNRLGGQLEEVSPPETLQTLKQMIDAYDPQVRILSPRPGEVVESTSVSVRFQVRGLPIYKDQQWELGPHLHVFLDDQPYRAVYDLSEPLVLSDLAPGTHTLRVFASRPWHESFKNQGAFDQRTFHVFAQTPQKALDKNQPLLTYSRPQGSYGAEPILLDFYLTNAPLHAIAQESTQDNIPDWRIRCTINGQSFVFDQWQPVYLKGFKPGQNWVQLELIDENGNLIDNAFNNTVRVITYEPGGEDTLSKLVRDELGLKQVAGIIDPTYTPPQKAIQEAISEPEPSEEEPTASEAEPKPVIPEAAPVVPVVPPTEAVEPEPEVPAAEEPISPDLSAPAQEGPPEVSNPAELAPPVEETPKETVSGPKTDTFEELEQPEPAPEPATEPEEVPPGLPIQDSPALTAPKLPIEMAPSLTEGDPAPTSPGEQPAAELPETPQIPDVLDAAPSSSRFFKGFKQWQQRSQQPNGPSEMAPAVGPRELPDALSNPETSLESPAENLEAPVETLPEIVVPPDAGTVEAPLDLVEPEVPAEPPAPSEETEPTPAKAEQLLI